MTAACITLDQIEARTATSVALAIYARRVQDTFVSIAVGKPLLGLLNLRLNQLKTPLRSGFLEKLSDEQLAEVAGLLKNLNACLLRLAEDERLRTNYYLKSGIERIRENREDFESILENIYLTLDPGFHKAVSSAIDKLNLGVDDRAAMLR